jgi:hypothetical protein
VAGPRRHRLARSGARPACAHHRLDRETKVTRSARFSPQGPLARADISGRVSLTAHWDRAIPLEAPRDPTVAGGLMLFGQRTSTWSPRSSGVVHKGTAARCIARCNRHGLEDDPSIGRQRARVGIALPARPPSLLGATGPRLCTPTFGRRGSASAKGSQRTTETCRDSPCDGALPVGAASFGGRGLPGGSHPLSGAVRRVTSRPQGRPSSRSRSR